MNEPKFGRDSHIVCIEKKMAHELEMSKIQMKYKPCLSLYSTSKVYQSSLRELFTLCKHKRLSFKDKKNYYKPPCSMFFSPIRLPCDIVTNTLARDNCLSNKFYFLQWRISFPFWQCFELSFSRNNHMAFFFIFLCVLYFSRQNYYFYVENTYL